MTHVWQELVVRLESLRKVKERRPRVKTELKDVTTGSLLFIQEITEVDPKVERDPTSLVQT